jgi:hypothetical protein
LPLWFIEGMAEYLSLGPIDPNTAMWLRDAVREKDGKDSLPSIDDLDNPKYFPYRWVRRSGRTSRTVRRRRAQKNVAIGAAAGGDTNVAIEKVLGVKTKQLSDEWQESIRQTYRPILASTMPPNEIGRIVVRATGLGGDINVGPAVSPDGRWVAFLSTRSIFSIDPRRRGGDRQDPASVTSTANDRTSPACNSSIPPGVDAASDDCDCDRRLGSPGTRHLRGREG